MNKFLSRISSFFSFKKAACNCRIGSINMNSSSSMNINGVSYQSTRLDISGSTVTLSGDVIDIKDIPKIEITIVGDVKTLDLSMGTIEVSGDATQISTMSGDVTVGGTIFGEVSTMSGDVTAGIIEGNVDTMSGDVKVK